MTASPLTRSLPVLPHTLSDIAIPELVYNIHRQPTPTWKIEEELIRFTDLTYVVGGEATYQIGDRSYIVGEGDLICIPPGTYRRASTPPGRPIESYAANFTLTTPDGSPCALPLPIVSHIGIQPGLRTYFQRLTSAWAQREFGYELVVRGYLTLIIQQALRLYHDSDYTQIHRDPRIVEAISYIHKNYSSPLRLDKIADMLHLHPVYFSQLFRKTTGIPFRQYVLSVRLNYAENILFSGEYSVTETASKCGFSDIYYFSRQFKKNKGYSPSDLLRS